MVPSHDPLQDLKSQDLKLPDICDLGPELKTCDPSLANTEL